MTDPDHSSLREKFVAVFQTVLPSLGGGGSLGLLLTSLEACLSNDAGVFVSALVEPSGDRRPCQEFTAWVFSQLVVVHGDLRTGEVRQRATAFALRLLRTLHARDPLLLAGPVLDVWIATLRQLTADGGVTLRLVGETSLPSVVKTLQPGLEVSRFRCGVLEFALADEVTQLLVLTGAQLDEVVACLTQLGRTGACRYALRAVTGLLGRRLTSPRHQLLLSRLERPAPPPVPPLPAVEAAADFAGLPADRWQRDGAAAEVRHETLA
ncbi:uncharacterized protein LOC119104389 [Pollicipes pollicipes]|uniref:uncharacterized protein LOC119104389 n=1 Tax=Pollicipes pollicipes TaxID=41117 RepID=UPI0018855806|nr:uncharacterized protein LOC119104389 [Pollicipes pollicipes]